MREGAEFCACLLSPPSLGLFLSFTSATFQEPWAPSPSVRSSSYKMSPGLAGRTGKERRHVLAEGEPPARVSLMFMCRKLPCTTKELLAPQSHLLDTEEG